MNTRELNELSAFMSEQFEVLYTAYMDHHFMCEDGPLLACRYPHIPEAEEFVHKAWSAFEEQ